MKLQRKNNIGLIKVIGDNNKFEILKYSPNEFYKKESEFVLIDNDFYISSNGQYKVHKNCFVNRENYYTIATIENGIPTFVSNRPMELESIDDMRDFLTILRNTIKKSLNYVVKSK